MGLLRTTSHHFMHLVLTSLLLWAFCSASAFASGITYHGRILNPDGTPVTDASVQFKMDILTPDLQSCVMYEESQTKNLSTSAGAFSITINDGTGTRTDTTGLAFDTIFGNRGTFTLPIATCSAGTGVYSPAAGDGRSFQVYFKTSHMTTWEPLPAQSINFAPFTIESKQVGGFPANTLLRVADPVTGPSAVSALTPTNFTNLQALLAGSSTMYVQSGANGAPIPSLATNPGSPSAGDIWFNSANHTLDYYDGSAIQTIGTGSDTVTSIGTGPGLTGGPITSAGTISLATTGTAGTYTKVVTDAYGRVASGSQITGNDITSGTIGGTTAINTAGAINTTNSITATNVSANGGSFRSIVLNDAQSPTPNTATLKAPAAISTNYTLTLPTAAPGVGGSMLVSDTSGTLTWVTPTSGTVTSITAGTGLTGGTITGVGTIGLANSGVTAGTFGSATVVPQITVNQQGQITSETDVTISGVAPGGAAGGDLAGTYPNPSVAKIQGTPVSSTAPTAAGEVLKYDGSTQYLPGFIGIADIRSTQAGNTVFFPLTCNAGQTLTYSAVTDTMSCTAIAISDSAITYAPRAANTFFAAPSGAAGAPSFRLITPADLPNGGYDSTYFKNGGNSFGGAATLGTNDDNNLTFETNGAARVTVLSSGNVGIGTTSATAALQLKAGAASAGGAPLKLTAGLNLTTPESGAIEYDGTSLYYTDGTNTRYALAAAGSGLTALSGDVTATGNGPVAATVNRVNGVTYGSSPSTNTVPVVTAANTVTYETLPNASLTNSSVTLGTTNVALGATASSLAALNSVGLGVNGTTTGTLTMGNGASGGATTTVQPSTLTTTAGQ